MYMKFFSSVALPGVCNKRISKVPFSSKKGWKKGTFQFRVQGLALGNERKGSLDMNSSQDYSMTKHRIEGLQGLGLSGAMTHTSAIPSCMIPSHWAVPCNSQRARP